jgi:hypothetical protein
VIIKRDERILDARYLSREGDTGTRWWSAMRGRNRLSVFNDAVVSSEIALGGRPGQVVFQDFYGVKPPSTGLVEPLVDPTKWIGAYNWEDGAGANLVTSAPGSAADSYLYVGNVAGTAPLTAGGPSGSTQCVDISHVGASSRGRAFTLATEVNPTELTVAFFAKKAVGMPDVLATRVTRTDPGFLLFTGFVALNANSWINDAQTFFSFSATVAASDFNWHHYAFTWAASDGVVTAYRDGVSVATASSTGTQRFLTAGFNSSNSSSADGFGDNLCVLSQKVSVAAVVALSSGHMPSSDGVLV